MEQKTGTFHRLIMGVVGRQSRACRENGFSGLSLLLFYDILPLSLSSAKCLCHKYPVCCTADILESPLPGAVGWLWVLPAKCHECLAGGRALTIKNIVCCSAGLHYFYSADSMLTWPGRLEIPGFQCVHSRHTEISRESWRQPSWAVKLGVL